MDRLHEKGFIRDAKNKNKSVVFTDEGFAKAVGDTTGQSIY